MYFIFSSLTLEDLLPKLWYLTENGGKTGEKHTQLLFESFRALTGCSIFTLFLMLTFLVMDEETIVKYVIPGLQHLQADADIQLKPLVETMIHDMQASVKHEIKKPEDQNPTANVGNSMGKKLFSGAAKLAATSISFNMGMGRKKDPNQT